MNENHWQVCAHDPHPAAFLAAARIAHRYALNNADRSGTSIAALTDHGWSPTVLDPLGRATRHSYTNRERSRHILLHLDGGQPAAWQITTPAPNATAATITATPNTPCRVLLALALAGADDESSAGATG